MTNQEKLINDFQLNTKEYIGDYRSRFVLTIYERNLEAEKKDFKRTYYSKFVGYKELYPKQAKIRLEKLLEKSYKSGKLKSAVLYLNLNQANTVNDFLALGNQPVLVRSKANRNLYEAIEPGYQAVQNPEIFRFHPNNGRIDFTAIRDEEILLKDRIDDMETANIYFNHLILQGIPEKQARTLCRYLTRFIWPK